MNARPAGFSSDEDDDLYGFDDGCEKYIPENNLYSSLNNYTDTDNEKVIEVSDIEKLELAIRQGDLKEVQTILQKDVDVNEVFPHMQWTPLLYAASFGYYDIITELLECGANPNTHRERFYPLMAVCTSSQPSDVIYNCIKVLLEFGASVELTDRFKLTSLMYASLHGHLEVVRLLLPLSYIGATDTQGWTALFHAVSRNHYEVVKYLLSEGADMYIFDVRGHSVKQLAIDKGFMDIVDLVTDDYEKEEMELAHIENTNQTLYWKDMFHDLGTSPVYFEDVRNFMFGCHLERRIQVLANHKIDFIKLLSMTDGELETLGFLPFERKIILKNVHEFHSCSWKQKSLKPITKKEGFSTFDGLVGLGTVGKHLAVINGSFNYILMRMNKSNDGILLSKEKNIQLLEQIKVTRKRTAEIRETLYKLSAVNKKVKENVTAPADYISTDNFKVKHNEFIKRVVFYGITYSVVFYSIYRYKKITSIFSKLIFSISNPFY